MWIPSRHDDSQVLIGVSLKDMEEESQETGKKRGWKLHSDGGQILASLFLAIFVVKSSKWVFPKIGLPPNHPFLIGFSIINRPFWDTTIFGNTQMKMKMMWENQTQTDIP